MREKNASVQVVLTKNANKFVTETTLQALSGRRVRTDLWDNEAEASMSHIELARWAECVIVAPATAEFLSRLATGSALDLLSTLCLATQAPLMIAPSMNHVMWKNQAVQDNCSLLKSRGTYIIGPGHGEQACGEIGYGRMAEPLDIIDYVLLGIFSPSLSPRPSWLCPCRINSNYEVLNCYSFYWSFCGLWFPLSSLFIC